MPETTTTLPPGVIRLPLPCWGLRYRNGMDVSEDGEPHYVNEDKARRSAAHYESATAGTPEPYQFDAHCYAVVAACGYALDEDNAGLYHYSTVAEAEEDARNNGWTKREDGSWRCFGGCDQGCNDAPGGAR